MPKNIILCCDGTANEFAQDRTNVVKLFYTLEQHDPAQQVVYYHPGLGTMEPSAELSPIRRRIAKLLGLAFGYGLEFDIRDAYVFLMNNYEEGDRVFLFGFSRGAYTVRAVASLLRMYGLIPRGNEPLVPYAIRMLMAIHKIESKGRPATEEEHRYFKLADDFKKTFAWRSCKPWFVGVWDTVSSVGWYENPLHLPYTAENPDIEIGRHAISIDERRAFFRSNLWIPKAPPAPSGPKDLKQVWFPGVHCDVGGGYPEAESGLSKITFEWMLREAAAAGLLVDPLKCDAVLGRSGGDYVPPNANAPMHQSLKGFWWLAEILWKRHWDWDKHVWKRRPNLGCRRTIPAGSLIHEAAYQRGEEYKKLLPPDGIPTGEVAMTTTTAFLPDPYRQFEEARSAMERVYAQLSVGDRFRANRGTLSGLLVSLVFGIVIHALRIPPMSFSSLEGWIVSIAWAQEKSSSYQPPDMLLTAALAAMILLFVIFGLATLFTASTFARDMFKVLLGFIGGLFSPVRSR